MTPPSMETITYAFNKVDFKADVQRIGEIEMTDVQVTVMHMPVDAQFIVIPSSLSLKLQGGVEVLKNISKKDISVTINYRSRYRYKGKRIPATIQVPRNISFTDVRPKFFELVVER